MNLKRIRIVFVITISVSGQINADEFKTNAYGIDAIPQLENPRDEIGLVILQNSYKAHLDEIRTTKNPYLLKLNGYKYFLSVYDVIFNEIAKMKLSVKESGNSVCYEGRNKNEVIKCNFAGNVKNYTLSNWNYILLINVLNQVKNSDKQIDINLINETAKHIAQDSDYKIYQEKIKYAEQNIAQYFEQLNLYTYLTDIRSFDFDAMFATAEKDYKEKKDTSRDYSLNNLDMTVSVSKAYKEFKVLLTSKIDKTDWLAMETDFDRYYGKSNADKELLYINPGYFISGQPRGIYKKVPSYPYLSYTKKLKLPVLDLNTLHDHETKCITDFLIMYKPAFLSILSKATTVNLDSNEKFFLDLYCRYKYIAFCCHNEFYPETDPYLDAKYFIHFTLNDSIIAFAWNEMKHHAFDNSVKIADLLMMISEKYLKNK